MITCLAFQGWFEQQALPVQHPRQYGHCWGRAKECTAAPLWGHPAGGNQITHFLCLTNRLKLCVMLRTHTEVQVSPTLYTDVLYVRKFPSVVCTY